MYFIIYSSYATKVFGDDELIEMLVCAREKNKRLGVTGMLLHFNDEFLQLIEGEEPVVKQLYKTIAKDGRHQSSMIMREGPISVRFFSDWSMAFKSLSPVDFENIEGFKDSAAPGRKNAAAIFSLFKILSAQ